MNTQVLEVEQSFKSKLVHYIEHVHKKYQFSPSGKDSLGRSTLSEQLNDLDNKDIRDCKLASFMLAKFLQDHDLPVLLVTVGTGAHPYILIPKLDQYNSGTDLGDCCVHKISLHVHNFGIETLTFMRNSINWNSVNKSSVQEHMRLKAHSIDENGIRSLDAAYLNAIQAHAYSQEG